MKRIGKSQKFLKGAAFALALSCVLALPGLAFAAATRVSGIDFYYGGADAPTDGSVQVLSLGGDEDATVYVKVEKDGKTIADRLPLTYDEDSATKGADGSYAGTAALAIDGFDPEHATYSVTAYADRTEAEALYSGTIVPVYARLDDGTTALLALRTIGESDADRTFTAPATFEYKNESYELADANPVSAEGEPLTYAYTKTTAAAVTGTITYVDADGNTLDTQSIEGITADAPQAAAIKPFVEKDGVYYYTVCAAKQVTASVGGSTSFVISCHPFDHADQAFRANIVAKGDDGTVLFTDSVLVNRSYVYTMPSTVSRYTGSEVAEYVLADGNDALEEGTNQLVLTTAANTDKQAEITYEVRYTKQDSSASMTWTVNAINGTAEPGSADRTISSQSFQVTPDQDATYNVEPSITIDGTEYVPVTGTQASYSYSFGSGANPVLNIYYVPKNYVAEKDYDVTVNYVNIATGEVVGSKKVTVPAGITEDLQIETPESFLAGNITYVRLAGQEAPIQHGYYTGYRTYTVYYRDSRDTLNANTVITTVVVSYGQGATTPGAGATGAAAGATAIGAAAGQGLTAADGANGTDDATLTTPDGQTLEEQRIDDNATPLAGPSAASAIMSSPTAIAGVLAAIAAVVCLVIYFAKRRKKDQTPADETNQEGGR